jgi:hypothetical protein
VHPPALGPEDGHQLGCTGDGAQTNAAPRPGRELDGLTRLDREAQGGAGPLRRGRRKRPLPSVAGAVVAGHRAAVMMVGVLIAQGRGITRRAAGGLSGEHASEIAARAPFPSSLSLQVGSKVHDWAMLFDSFTDSPSLRSARRL